MDKEFWERIEGIVDQAQIIADPNDQTQFIDEKCGNNKILKAEVTSLLNSIERSGEFWDQLIESTKKLSEEISVVGIPELGDSIIDSDVIGNYRIKELIGRGGMGDVYLAEHISEEFHTNVVLKIIRKEIGKEEQIKRFIQERRILSELNHPNIARLLDGGISDDGRPYLIMEYVDGEPVNTFSLNRKCSLSERLKLFKDICKAVEYAHNNFIVHRDLKPDNILVTEDGESKILDFGIAKFLDYELSEKELIETRQENRILSLNYAAPEQIDIEVITAATDVYTLGLLLYELLNGYRAFDFKKKKIAEIEYDIKNKQPAKPSQNSSKYFDSVTSDLDAIVLKCLRKLPKDRYTSVARLIDDIERYEENRPVLARRGSSIYTAQKFIRRNFQPLMVATFFVLMTVIFGTYHYLQITEERNIAKLEAEKAKRVTGILVATFEYADPWKEPNPNITAREILSNGLKFIDSTVSDGPEIKAVLFSSIGEIYEALGEYKKADSLLQKAIVLEQELANSGEDNLSSMAMHQYRLGKVKQFLGQPQQARELLEKASYLFNKNEAYKDAAASDLEWGWIELSSAKYDKADSLFSNSLNVFREFESDTSINTSGALSNLGWIEFYNNNYQKSDSLFNESIRIKRLNYKKSHPDLARALHSQAWIKYNLNELNEAERLQQESNDMRREAFQSQPNFDLAWGLNNMGIFKQALGKLDEAENLFNAALEMRRATLPPTHPHIAQSLGNLASLNFYRENFSKSAELFKSVIEFQRNVLPNDHPDLAMSLNNLGTVLSKANKDNESISYFIEALDILKNKLGDHHDKTIQVRSNFADSYENMNQFENAEELRLKNYKVVIDNKGIENQQSQIMIKSLVELYQDWNRPEKVAEYKGMLSIAD